jgi:hypothetical protein
MKNKRSTYLQPGLTELVGTGLVWSVPGGTGPAWYLNRPGSHPQTVPTN